MAETDYRRMVVRALEAAQARGQPVIPSATREALPFAQFVAPELANLYAPAPTYQQRLEAQGGRVGPDAQIIPPPSGKIPSTRDPRELAAAIDAAQQLAGLAPIGGAVKAMAAGAGVGKKLLPGMLKEITGEAGAAQRFYDALKAMKEASPHGAPTVDLKTVKQYGAPGARLFLGPDDQSGFAMHGTELNSVFKHPQSPLGGAGAAITERALKEGADRLDAYATPQLMKQYGEKGFQEVARVPFANLKDVDKPALRAQFPELKGETPSFAEKKVGNIEVGRPGEPDVVGMVRNPPVATTGLPTPTFEDLQTLQGLAATGRPPNLFIPTAQRAFAPRIYENPRILAAEANARVAREHPALQEVFKLSRGDLLEQLQQRIKEHGAGDLPARGLPENPRGSPAVAQIETPENRQRIIDLMAEGMKYPALREGMLPWYIQDALASRMLQEGGDYPLLNAVQGSASARSAVEPEITRGSAAYMLQQQGRFPEFTDKTFVGIPGHMMHTTHAKTMENLFARLAAAREVNPNASVYDALTTDKVKQPAYIQSSGVPGVGGFSFDVPPSDAHFATVLGVPDVRTFGIKEKMGTNFQPAELAQLLPFWRGIASEFDLPSTPAQSFLWGVGSQATGVKTPIGAPKLELQAIAISDAAKEAGKSVDRFLADALKKKPTEHWLAPFGLGGGATGAAALDQFAAPEVPTVY